MAELGLDWEEKDHSFPATEPGKFLLWCSSNLEIMCKGEAVAQVAASERNMVQSLRPQ